MITSRLRIVALVGLLSVTGCTREVIVRETPAAGTSPVVNHSPGSSSSINNGPSSPSVTVSPVNDKVILCSRAWGRLAEIYTPSQAFWSSVLKLGFSAPEVLEAGDKFRDVAVKTLPILKALVGPEAPQEVANAISEYVDAAEKFSDAAAAHSTGDELNPLASKFGFASDHFKEICGKH